MKFYIGDSVRIKKWCKVLQDDPRLDFPSACAGKNDIFTIRWMKKFSDARIGFAFDGYKTPVYYDKRGLELVKRGPNAQRRNIKENTKKPTLKYSIGDKVRTKSNLKHNKEYGCLRYYSYMKAAGTIEIAESHDKTYKLTGSDFWYTEEMLESVQAVNKNEEIVKLLEEISGEIMKALNTFYWGSPSHRIDVKAAIRRIIVKHMDLRSIEGENGE